MPKTNEKESITVKSFIAAINHWRNVSGFNQTEAAAKLGLKPSTFGNIVRGNKGISFIQMDAIAETIGKSVPILLTEGKAILEGKQPPKGFKIADTEKSTYNPEQIKAIDDLLICWEAGGEAVDFLLKQLSMLAQQKRTEAGLRNPTPTQQSKSA